MENRRKISLDQFRAELKNTNKEILDIRFICPRCKTRQSGRDFINAGVGKTIDEIERYLAFSCIGRFSNNMGCDWTLGGLFKIHTLEVVTPDGETHPRFEIADQAAPEGDGV